MVGAPEIVAQGMDAAAVTEAMLGKLTDPEHRRGPMIGAVPGADGAGAGAAARRQGLRGRPDAGLHAGDAGGIADVSAKLDDIAGQSRETLEALALRFGEPEPEAMPLDVLKAFLIEKAKDYRRLETQVRALGDREGRIANLKAAAEDAVRDAPA